MRMPVRDLESNWAYMVMAALAWNLKAWFGLLMPNVARGTQVVKLVLVKMGMDKNYGDGRGF